MTATSTEDEAVGTAVHALRKAAGLRLADVAGLAGVSVTYLSNVENGKMRPSSDWVRNVMAAIGAHLRDAA